MKIALIEDESLASAYLKTLLHRQTILPIDSITILPSVKESIAYLSEQTVDLLFMDIHLGDGKSLEIFESVDISCPIIFVTAYDSYAIQVFKQFTIDYILKPFSEQELLDALNKFKSITQSFQHNNTLEALSSLDKDQQESYKTRFLVHLGHKLKSIEAAEIAYFFAQGKHLFITTLDNKTYIYNDTIKGVIGKLNEGDFFKINRKYIIQRKSILEIIRHSSQKVELILQPNIQENESILVSKNLINNFKEWLE
ncbi:LytR/AlgR family response regulator transcription factor [Myroides sp. LJL116]